MDGGANQSTPAPPKPRAALARQAVDLLRLLGDDDIARERRILIRRAFYWLFVISVLAAIIAYSLRWLGKGQADLANFVTEHYGSEIALYDQQHQKDANPPPFERPLGWITSIRAVKKSVPVTTAGPALPYEFTATINWWTLGLLALAYLTAAWAVQYALRLLGSSFGPASFTAHPEFKERGPALSWAVYKADIDNAQQFAQQLDRRSVLFLVIGSVIAIMGVAAVVMVFPQELRTNETTPQLLLRMARPIGLTIFIEAIAWYFLKQSRVLVEDQRAFYRMYLKRANYLAALGLLPEKREEAPELTAAVLWSLLHDPVTDRLAPGETTEALETMRALNELPVASGLKALLGADKPDAK
jgi:hypothetical protein